MTQRRLAIYTCIAGDYDELLLPAVAEVEADYFCFTDQPIADAKGWQLRPLPEFRTDGGLASRYVKMHPHRLFADHDVSVYVDANVRALDGIVALAEDALRRGCLAMYRHPFRSRLADEADECALLGYDFLWRFRRLMRRYAAEGLPPAVALVEANVLVRRHHDPTLIAAMELWWSEYRSGIRRDQLSLPYALWKQGIDVVDLGRSDARFDQAHFAMTPLHKHRSVPARQWFLRIFNRLLMELGR
jgi:hypothetical protein